AQSIQWHPWERWQVACRAWNRTVAAAPHSSFPPVIHVKSGGQWALKWSDFPSELRIALDYYEAAVTSANPLDLDHRKPIKNVTLRGYVANLRCYLSRLVKDGVPATEFT